MSKDGSKPKGTQGSYGECDLVSRAKLIRQLTSEDLAGLVAFDHKVVPAQKTIIPLEAGTQEDGFFEENEGGAGDDDWDEQPDL
jgi:hypothetical protein